MNNNNEYIEFEEYYEASNNNSETGEIKNESYEYEEQDRLEMENDYELVKVVNELKDKNKKLESVTKYQNNRIENLENELEKAINEIKLRDLELEEYRSKNSNQNNAEFKKQVNQMNQINNLTLQVEKYKNMFNDKKNEINGLLEKYNEIQKNLDKYQLQEKKTKQEMINKDKQISRLLEEIDKKNNITKVNTQPNTDKEIEKLQIEVKKLEKQKNDLTIAFKKSMKLCSILKRQKIHLENARLLAFTEEEFKQILDQNKI
jgi:hypothetical protein